MARNWVLAGALVFAACGSGSDVEASSSAEVSVPVESSAELVSGNAASPLSDLTTTTSTSTTTPTTTLPVVEPAITTTTVPPRLEVEVSPRHQLGLVGGLPASFDAAGDVAAIGSLPAISNVGGDIVIVSVTDAGLKEIATIGAAHGGGVTALSFGIGATFLLSGGEDGTVAMWSLENLKAPVWRLDVHLSAVTDIELAENWFTTAGQDRFIRRWDLQSKQMLNEWELDSSVVAIAEESSSGDLLAVGSEGEVSLLDPDGRVDLPVHVPNPTAITSGDGQFVVAGEEGLTFFDPLLAGPMEVRESSPVSDVEITTQGEVEVLVVGRREGDRALVDAYISHPDTQDEVLKVADTQERNVGVGLVRQGESWIALALSRGGILSATVFQADLTK